MRLRNLESRVFVILVMATSLFFLWMIRSFLPAVFWASVFAILFQPIFLRTVEAVGGRRSVAALLTTLVIVFAVLIPFGLLAAAVAQQGFGLYQGIASGEINLLAVTGFIERTMPALADFLAQYGIRMDQLRAGVENAAISGSQYLAGRALAIGQNVLMTGVIFALMLYLLFFFFRDGEKIMRGIIRALPMGDQREERLFTKFAEVSRATVKGTLVVAAVQGAMGGVLFALVGLPAAVFWAVVMGILSLLPAVGPALVWLPAAIILFTTGAVLQSIVVVVGGVFVVGLTDNLLRPMLIGRETQMPDYLILLATLGGLSVFGLAGFVAGPVIAALCLVMWEMFADEYAPLDSDAPLGSRELLDPDAPLVREAPPDSDVPALTEIRSGEEA